METPSAHQEVATLRFLSINALLSRPTNFSADLLSVFASLNELNLMPSEASLINLKIKEMIPILLERYTASSLEVLGDAFVKGLQEWEENRKEVEKFRRSYSAGFIIDDPKNRIFGPRYY